MKKLGSEPALFSSTALSPVRAREKERILYVEDDDAAFRTAELRLRESFLVCRASTAAEACTRLQKDDKFAAVLIDGELKGSDLGALELIKLLRGRLRREAIPSYAQDMKPVELSLIFLCAQPAKHSETALLLSGVDRILDKPVEATALNLALTQLQLNRARHKSRTHF